MKRFPVVSFALALVLGSAGCGSSNDDPEHGASGNFFIGFTIGSQDYRWHHGMEDLPNPFILWEGSTATAQALEEYAADKATRDTQNHIAFVIPASTRFNTAVDADFLLRLDGVDYTGRGGINAVNHTDNVEVTGIFTKAATLTDGSTTLTLSQSGGVFNLVPIAAP